MKGKQRKMYAAVNWSYVDAPSQRLMVCERGRVERAQREGRTVYRWFANDGRSGECFKRCNALNLVERPEV